MKLATDSLNEYEFWAYNKELAIALGYVEAKSQDSSVSQQEAWGRDFEEALEQNFRKKYNSTKN